MAIFGILGILLLILIAISIFKLTSFLILIIPKYGLQFLILKCPNCNKRGGLKKNWIFSTEKETETGNNDEIIDIEMVVGVEKTLSCKKCNHKISI